MKALIALGTTAVAVTVLVVVILSGRSGDHLCTPNRTIPTNLPGTSSPGSKVSPVDPATPISSGYRESGREDHQGIDLAAAEGSPIFAYSNGVVAAAGEASGFGNWIVIDHNDGGEVTSTVYGHMYADGVHVAEGDAVEAGQHIGDVGSAGKSSGPHLHWEVWPGGRLSGGQSIDPTQMFHDAAPAGTDGASPTEHSEDDLLMAGEELPELPDHMGSEANWQTDTVRVARAVAQRWPDLERIGGYRPDSQYDDHPSGRAADIMIPNWETTQGIETGDEINEWVLANADELNVEYTIWRGKYYQVGSDPTPYTAGDGTPTGDHFDHVHVTTVGGGAFDGGAVTGPDESASTPQGSPYEDCAPQRAPAGGDIAPGTVPEGWDKWFRLSAQQCEQITPSLLAAQVGQESGFALGQVSPDNARGISQFIDSTWATYGAEVDDNGEPIGPPGSGDQDDPADAIMAQGRYMCTIADTIDAAIDDGSVSAPNGREELYLAAYNAGEGAVLQAGGFPSGGDYTVQTRPYADAILAAEPDYRAELAEGR